jgi:hypothetical protein
VEFENAKEFIESYIDKTSFRQTYDIIMSHINLLMNDQPLPDYDLDKIKNDIRDIYVKIFNHDTEFEYLRFIEAVSEMVFNWNSNTVNDPDITVYTTSMKKFIPIILNMKNSIIAMKESIEKFRRYKGWSPPVTDISLAYLDSLLKDK